MSDVLTAAVTDKFALMANGTTYVGRAVVEADIDDLQSYTLPADALITLVGNGNHKVLYTNGSGVPVELTLGAANTVLTSAGATSAPTFSAPAATKRYIQVSGVTTVTLTGTPKVLDLVTTDLTTGTGDFTVASDLVTVKNAGDYSIYARMCTTDTNTSGGAEHSTLVNIQVEAADIPGGKGRQRGREQHDGGCDAECIATLSADDEVRVMVSQTIGSTNVQTIPTECHVIITQID